MGYEWVGGWQQFEVVVIKANPSVESLDAVFQLDLLEVELVGAASDGLGESIET